MNSYGFIVLAWLISFSGQPQPIPFASMEACNTALTKLVRSNHNEEYKDGKLLSLYGESLAICVPTK